MTEPHQISPIIPVIDERLGYQASAPADHKMKVDKYNELLEDKYQREVELTKIKSALVDMREEIAEEARLLDGTSETGETSDAAKDEEVEKEEEEEENGKEAEQLSDSSSKRDNLKKIYKKTKGKAKGHAKRSKMADSELDAEWDYKLELLRSGSVKKERRASDASGKEVDIVPLRAKAGLTASH